MIGQDLRQRKIKKYLSVIQLFQVSC